MAARAGCVKSVFRVPRDGAWLLSAALAEFWGTLFFVFVAAGAADACTRGYTGAYPNATIILPAATAAGIVVAVAIAATGGVSGGHLNPALTLGFLSVGRIDVCSALAYIAAQLLGAILGIGLVKAVVPPSWGVSHGLHSLAQGVSPGEGLIAEIIFSSILMFVIYGTAIDPRGPNSISPLCVGLSVLAVHVFGVGVTGGSMNPARSFAPAVWTGLWANQWVYWVGPILGTVITSLFYENTILRTAVFTEDVNDVVEKV